MVVVSCNVVVDATSSEYPTGSTAICSPSSFSTKCEMSMLAVAVGVLISTLEVVEGGGVSTLSDDNADTMHILLRRAAVGKCLVAAV